MGRVGTGVRGEDDNDYRCKGFCCHVQGKRYALPNTRIMLHHPSGSARGQASDIHNEARELMRLRNYVNKVLCQATGKPIEKVQLKRRSPAVLMLPLCSMCV